MSEAGKSITNGFRELRNFFQQVALLLQHANEMMEAGGWKYISKRMSTTDVDTKLEDSDGWLPETVFCFYQKPNVAFSTVHICHHRRYLRRAVGADR